MKIKDKLYKLIYNEEEDKFKRTVTVHVIENIDKTTIKFVNCPWKFKKSIVGTLYFLSKKEAYQKSLKQFRKLYKTVSKPLLKEIKYLENRLMII